MNFTWFHLNRRRAAWALASLAFIVLAWLLLFPAGSSRLALVDVVSGASARAIADRFHRAGLLRFPLWFRILARLSGRPLQAGEYGFRRVTPWGLLRTVQDGRVYQHRVLVREGDAVPQVAAALAAEKLADPESFRKAARDRRTLAKLGIKGGTAEGWCFPDTYLFPKGMTDHQMLERMVARFREKVPESLAAAAAEQGLSRRQWVTLASIVEKEAKVPEERPVIAGVFLNRLRRGMRLEADPTVCYALERWDMRLVLADLRVDHPYNTYRNAGLPPGPICNPGLAALEATARPAKVPWLFFVTRKDGSGTHEFTRTLAEHLRATRDSKRREQEVQPAPK